MNNVLRDKAWARRFARTSGDLGITHIGPRYRFPIRIWTPTKVPQKARRITATVPEPLREPSRAASAPVDDNPSLRAAGVDDSHDNAGAGVSQAARMRVGAHRPFSGQTIDASPRVRGQDCYTSPTVRGLSGETPEHPHTNLPASPDACSRVQVGTGRQSIHASPCTCGDDAQRHYALIARDLIAAGRDGELTDDMRQAYDYEFGGVQEPEPPQIPEF